MSKQVDPFLDHLIMSHPLALSGVPSLERIIHYANYLRSIGEEEKVLRLKNIALIYRQSIIPPCIPLGQGSMFGYGGSGVVLHSDSELGSDLMISPQVVIGGGGGRSRDRSSQGLAPSQAAFVDDYCFVGPGSIIIGGVVIGKLSIIGAGSLVRESVPPLSIVAGMPAKVIGSITESNCSRYFNYFYPLRQKGFELFRNLVRKLTAY